MTQTYIATDADDFDVFEPNHYDVFLHLALNGTSEQMGDMIGD